MLTPVVQVERSINIQEFAVIKGEGDRHCCVVTSLCVNSEPLRNCVLLRSHSFPFNKQTALSWRQQIENAKWIKATGWHVNCCPGHVCTPVSWVHGLASMHNLLSVSYCTLPYTVVVNLAHYTSCSLVTSNALVQCWITCLVQRQRDDACACAVAVKGKALNVPLVY